LVFPNGIKQHQLLIKVLRSFILKNFLDCVQSNYLLN
jgi:hypothetical protein